MRRLPLGLGAAVLVYVALRALILVFAFDQVALVNYELYPMGTLPKALAVARDFPLRLYYDNAAGQLVTGLAAVPFYAALGDSYLVLKLVPATAGLGMLLCVWALLDRHVSRRAANLAGFALALGPAELLTKYSLIASGNHFENLFFIALATLAAYRVHVAPPERRARRLVLAGFASGFAIFVFLGALIPVGLLALVHFGVRGWRGTLADLRLSGPGFALGIAPLVAVNLLSGARGAAFLEAKFAGDGGRDWGLVLERMRSLVLVDLPRAGFFRSFDGVDVRIPNVALLACTTIAWLAALPAALAGVGELLRAARGRERGDESATFARLLLAPFVLALPLTVLAFGISNLKTGQHFAPTEIAGFRYLLPTFLFGVILVAVVADRAIARGGASRAFGWTLAGVTLATGAWNLSYVEWGTPARNLGSAYRGWNFMQAARGLFNHAVGLDQAERLEIVAGTPQPFRAQLLRGMGFHTAQGWLAQESRVRGESDLELVRRGELPTGLLLRDYPEAQRLEVARGMGTGLRTYVLTRGGARTLEACVAEGLARLVERGDPFAWAVLEGAGLQEDYPLPRRKVPVVLARSERLLELLPEELRGAYGRGLGEFCGRLWSRDVAPETALLRDTLHRSYGAVGDSLLVGVGFGLALEGEAPRLPTSLLELTPLPELRARVVAGYEEGLRSLYPDARVDALLADLGEGWR